MNVALSAGANGLPKLTLSHASGSTAEVYLDGAHVTSWIPAGQPEALFLSRSAVFAPGTAIRGGIPIIFPQFGSLGPLPKHGFARVRRWQWIGGAERADAPGPAVLRLEDSEETRAVWPHGFRAELTVDLRERSLAVGLSVQNPGPSPFTFTAALHTYLRLEDVKRAAIRGLQGTRYREGMRGEERPDPDPELLVSGEIDRVYLNAPPEVRVHDGAGGRTFRIGTQSFSDLVVWNPWREGAEALPDMEAEEHRRMLCVEAAQAGEPVLLPSGAVWRGEQRIEVAATDAT